MMYETAIKAILLVLVIATVAGIAGKMISPTVGSLLGITNESIFDDGKRETYESLQGMDTEAIDSMKALLYSINRLSWLDTYSDNAWEFEEGMTIADELSSEWYVLESGELKKGNPPEGYDSIGTYDDFGRSYGDTNVVPTILDSYLIYYSEETKDALTKQLAKDIVDCFIMFKDQARENTRCFSGDFSLISKDLKIKEEDIENGLVLLAEDEDMCDEGCQKELKDITGGPVGIFNRQNWEFDVVGNVITSQNNQYRNKVVRICADKKSKDRVYITDDIELCKTPQDSMLFTMAIENFYLPQEITVPTTLAEKAKYASWLPRGDPDYLVYYEKFPKGEDSAWTMNSYSELKDFLTYEAFVLGLSFVPIVGKPFSILLSKHPTLVHSTIAYLAKIKGIIERNANNPDDAVDIEIIVKNIGSLVSATLGELIDVVNAIIEYEDEFIDEIHIANIGEYLSVKYSGESFIMENFGTILESLDDQTAEKLKRQDYYDAFMITTENSFKDGMILVDDKLLGDGYIDRIKEAFYNIDVDGLDEDEEKSFSELLIFEMESAINFGLDDHMWFYDAASQSNDKFIELSNLDDDEAKDELERIVTENADLTAWMERNDKDYLDMKEIVLKMMLDEQDLNPSIDGWIEGSIDQNYGRLYGLYPVEERSVQGDDDIDRDKETIYISDEITTYMMRIASQREKDKMLGTNAIGLKTPFRATINYDDVWTRDWDWPSEKDKYLDYFEHFGGEYEKDGELVSFGSEKYDTERYFGLLPEAESYYMSLVRDKTKNPFSDQQDIRFHLVSPCKADILMHVTRCECYGEPVEEEDTDSKLKQLFASPAKYETGEYNDALGMVVPHFDGENKMLYQIDEETGAIIKECTPKDIGDYIPWNDDHYTPKCIEFDLLIDPETDMNYCYRGYKPYVLQIADFTLNWAMPTLCITGISGVTGGFGAPGGALCSVVGRLLYTPYERTCYAWPNRGSSLIC